MKKLFKNILFDVFIFMAIYFALHFVLKSFNLIFMPCIRSFARIVIIIGIIVGVIQANLKIDKNRIGKKIIAWLGFFVLIIFMTIAMLFYIIFFHKQEEIDYYENTKMIKETTSVFKANWIKYYDYTNPFVRSRQERVKVQYDDTISEDEYAGTTYYDKNGIEVQDFEGTPYIDLTELKKYNSNNLKYDEVVKLIDEIKQKFSDNFYNITDTQYSIRIDFSNNLEEVAKGERKERAIEIIDNFIENESQYQDVNYSVYILNTGRISIINTLNMTNNSDEFQDRIYITRGELAGYAQKMINDFLESPDIQSKKLNILYNNNASIKIKYVSFIDAEHLDEVSDAECVGYYEYYVDGELKNTYYYPSWKLEVVEENQKSKLVMKSDNETIIICEYNKKQKGGKI